MEKSIYRTCQLLPFLHTVIGLICTATACNDQAAEAKRYEAELETAYKANVKRGAFQGIAMGATFFFMFSVYGVAFSFGAGQVRSGAIDPGDILTTFFSVFIATFSLDQAAPSFNSFAVARGAAFTPLSTSAWTDGYAKSCRGDAVLRMGSAEEHRSLQNSYSMVGDILGTAQSALQRLVDQRHRLRRAKTKMVDVITQMGVDGRIVASIERRGYSDAVLVYVLMAGSLVLLGAAVVWKRHWQSVGA